MNGASTPLVVHVVHRLDVGGLENGVVNLVNRMPANRYRHAIVCLAGYGAEFRKRIRREDVEVTSLDKRPGKDVAVYARMWRELRRLRPAVVHTRNLGTVDMQWVAWAAGVGARVHGEHGWEASDPQGLSPRSLRIRRACRPVIQRYVPMSQDIARWLVREVGAPRDRIRQLYNGVDTERFRPADPRGDRGREALAPGFFARDALVFGTVGRLDPVKNQESLLRSFRAISDREPALAPRLRLLVAGDGPLRSRLEALAVELQVAERVWFAGARSDTPEILRAMDAYVLPSLNEGISNTILEAMASGLPVIASRVGGNPELVVDEATGALYDAAEPGSLERAILAYLTNPDRRRAHGEAGRARVVQNFSLDSMVQRYLDLYDELLTGTPAPGGTGQVEGD